MASRCWQPNARIAASASQTLRGGTSVFVVPFMGSIDLCSRYAKPTAVPSEDLTIDFPQIAAEKFSAGTVPVANTPC